MQKLPGLLRQKWTWSRHPKCPDGSLSDPMNPNAFQPLLDRWHTNNQPALEVLKMELSRTLKKTLELAEFMREKNNADSSVQQTMNRVIHETTQELLQQDQEEESILQSLLQKALNGDPSSPVVQLLCKASSQFETVKRELLLFKQQLELEEAVGDEDKKKAQAQQVTLSLNIQRTLLQIADELTHELFVQLNYFNQGLCCPKCKKNYVTVQEETIEAGKKAYTYICHSCNHTEQAFGEENLAEVRKKWVTANA